MHSFLAKGTGLALDIWQKYKQNRFITNATRWQELTKPWQLYEQLQFCKQKRVNLAILVVRKAQVSII